MRQGSFIHPSTVTKLSYGAGELTEILRKNEDFIHESTRIDTNQIPCAYRARDRVIAWRRGDSCDSGMKAILPAMSRRDILFFIRGDW